MIGIEQALSLVLERATPRVPQRESLCQTLGRVLAEEVISDIDSPPFDKALMDGFAVVASDLRGGRGELMMIDDVAAGDVPCEPLQSGMATRIMTGAPVPRGADAVIVGERCQLDTSGDIPTVRIDDRDVRPGQNILGRGMSIRRGETVLQAGRSLSAIDAGLLAEVGRTQVLLHPQPSVAVLATGNELVPACDVPGPGQIRNSNGPMLCALVSSAGGQPVDVGIARDTEAELAQQINRGLHEDVLILSGGVSTGILDLVPRVLRDLGVEQVFHGVCLKPGKPLWFGVRPHAKGPRLVFGLPGNPVSGLVCFELFVRPAIAALAGQPQRPRASVPGKLTSAYRQRGDRPTYYPVRLERQGDQTLVRLLDWLGSADLRTLACADGLAVFPAGRTDYEADETVTVLLL
jgi:molybdopterin molybdotransferase